MTDHTPPRYAKDGPTVIPGDGPQLKDGTRIDKFIPAPLPELERAPAAGDMLHYWPSPQKPMGPLGTLHVEDAARPMRATVAGVHNPRLVDLHVTDHAGAKPTIIRFVPLVHAGDPDPGSPVGRCEWPAEGS